MQIKLISQSKGIFLFSLEISEKEMASSDLHRQIEQGICSVQQEFHSSSTLIDCKTEQVNEPLILKQYKKLPVHGNNLSYEEALNRIFDYIISENKIIIPENEIDAEVERQLLGYLQRAKYQMLFGGRDFEMPADKETLAVDIRQHVIREYKIKRILEYVIDQEQLSVENDELLHEAEALAARQNSTLEMVKRFMGEDFHLLHKDVLLNKAKKFLYNSSVK